MKRLLTVLALLLCVGARAAIFQNAFTTNANTALGATSSSTYPIMIDTANGIPGPNGLFFSPSFRMASTNAFFSGNLSLNGRTNKLSIVNDTLYLDGVAVGGSTTTNFYSTIITTNLTVLNSLTVSNITVTNVTVVNNMTTSNLFYVSGKGNTLIVTQALTLNYVKTNLLATDANGLVTNANYGSGISWDPSTLTLSATATGGVTTDVTTLGWSGTNITGFDCSTNGESFYLFVTNNAHFGTATFSNLPAKTAYKTYTLCLQMNSTGGYIVTYTNTVVGWALGQPVFIETNANAVSYVYLHTDLSTNSTLVGTGNVDVRR